MGLLRQSVAVIILVGGVVVCVQGITTSTASTILYSTLLNAFKESSEGSHGERKGW